MAGKADRRGTTQLHNLHLIGSGVWGGFISILAGVLGMMADKRTKIPFKVPRYYYPYFAVLTISSFLGFLISVISLGINGAMIGNVANDCSSTSIDSRLWLYVDLVSTRAPLSQLICLCRSNALLFQYLRLMCICGFTQKLSKTFLIQSGYSVKFVSQAVFKKQFTETVSDLSITRKRSFQERSIRFYFNKLAGTSTLSLANMAKNYGGIFNKNHSNKSRSNSCTSNC